MLQFVSLLTAPVMAVYALGGLLASPVIIPAIILKNLVMLVRFGSRQAAERPAAPLHCTTPAVLDALPLLLLVMLLPASSLLTCCPHRPSSHPSSC